ncbi:MAG: class I SAM-dependent methyltransferase [Burkholderiales bacterium]
MADSAVAACPLCATAGKHAYSGRDIMLGLPKVYAYHTCPSCKAVYQHPMPDKQTIAGFYPAHYDVYREDAKPKTIGLFEKAVLHRWYGYRSLQSPVAYRVLAGLVGWGFHRDSIAAVDAGSALDIGCGNGRFLRKLRELGWHCEGLDFSQTAVEVCRAAGLKVHHGDLYSAGFSDRSFDLVTTRHVIEHVPDPAALMEEIARILKPGGRVIIQTPNSQALARGRFGAHWYANDIPRHLVLFCPTNLDALASRFGLECIRSKTCTSPKIILNSIDYALGSNHLVSKKIRWRRMLARLYVVLATLTGRGDELYAVYRKR